MYCPTCSKKKDDHKSGNYKCTDCGTAFTVYGTKVTILEQGRISIADFLLSVILLPVILIAMPFIIGYFENADLLSFFCKSDNLIIYGLVLILHPLVMYPRQLMRREVPTLELVIAFFRNKIMIYGRLNLLEVHSTFFIILCGVFMLIAGAAL